MITVRSVDRERSVSVDFGRRTPRKIRETARGKIEK